MGPPKSVEPPYCPVITTLPVVGSVAIPLPAWVAGLELPIALAHRDRPSTLEYLATKILFTPTLVFQKLPVPNTSPHLSTARVIDVISEPPNCFAHKTEPLTAESLTSAMPPLFRVVAPKTMLGELNCAAKYMFPLPSTATLLP